MPDEAKPGRIIVRRTMLTPEIGLRPHKVVEFDHDEQGRGGGHRATLGIVHRGREIQLAADSASYPCAQDVRVGEKYWCTVVDLQAARYGEFTNGVEQETERSSRTVATAPP